jgi:hypothetical protein
MKKFFKYIEPLWQGNDNKISLRSFLAIVFSIHFMIKVSHVINRWDASKSIADAAMLLGLEAALIAALLALKTYQNNILKTPPTNPTPQNEEGA